jgi:hypothetical protein
MASLACGPGDVLLVAWEDRRDGERDVYVSRSLDFGHTWSDAVRLDVDGPGATPSYHPQVVWLDDGSAVVVWWDECHGAADLFVRRSSDGAAWGEAIRLDDGPDGTASRDAAVSAAGSSVVVAWEEVDRLGVASIRARRSADGGSSWGEIVACGPGEDPVAAVHASGAGVGWVVAQPGPGGRTSIAGRVMEIPGRTRFLATTIPSPGRSERVSELYGPTVQAMCTGADGLWAIGTGTASGKAVVEANRLVADRGWQSGAVLLFGGNGPLGYVPTAVRSVRAAASADGGLHLLWAADASGRGELGYRRLERPAGSSFHDSGA